MIKIFLSFLFIILLFLSFTYCQKSPQSELKSCSRACKSQFENAIGVCGAEQTEEEGNKCKFRVMNEYNDCVQKCNNNFIK